MNVLDEIKQKLKQYPDTHYESGTNYLKVFPSSPDGFLQGMNTDSSNYLVYFEGWHEKFEDPQQALNCFAFGLSEGCRLKIIYRGAAIQKWIVERKENEEWVFDSETGLLFFPYWRRKRIEYRQNHLIKIT